MEDQAELSGRAKGYIGAEYFHTANALGYGSVEKV